MPETQPQTQIATMLELQRRSLEQSRDAVERTLEMQRSAVRTFRDTIETQRSVQERSAALTKSAFHAYVDALEAALPEAGTEDPNPLGDLHDAIDEQFEAADAVADDGWEIYERMLTDGVDAYDELTGAQLELLTDSFDAYLEAAEEVEVEADGE